MFIQVYSCDFCDCSVGAFQFVISAVRIAIHCLFAGPARLVLTMYVFRIVQTLWAAIGQQTTAYRLTLSSTVNHVFPVRNQYVAVYVQRNV